jgi:catechol-2,3-dioxygenase
MAVTGIDHYNLRGPMGVLDAIRDWYRDTIGLRVGDRPPFKNRGYWLYAGAQPVLHLSEESAGESHPMPGEGTFDHVAFRCDDFDAMREHLVRRAIPFRVADVPLTRTRQIFLEDPAGNGVELNFEMR